MSRTVILLTLAGYVAILLYAGWMPLEFAWDRPAIAAEWAEAIDSCAIRPGDFLHNGDVQLNVLLFVPVGGLLAAAYAGRWRWRWVMAAAIGLSATISAMIETGQLIEANRFTRIHDIWANTSGGLIGALVGQSLFCGKMRSVWCKAAERAKGRHALLAAGVIAAALLAGTAWQMQASLSLLTQQYATTIWSPSDGLAAWPWHKWAIRSVAAYATLTLMLAATRRTRRMRELRVVTAMAVAVALATTIEAMHMLIPGPPPNVAAIALAAMSAGVAALIAPRLHERQIELPILVLVCAGAAVILAAHIGWLSSGGGTPLPLWGLYKHEFAWGYYSMIRRWAAMAGMSFLVAFYLSLTKPWRLRHRMVAAAAIAVAAAAGMELIRLLDVGRINIAGLGEHTLAAIAGVLLFALLWRILDRRGVEPIDIAYGGPDRRTANGERKASGFSLPAVAGPQASGTANGQRRTADGQRPTANG